MESYSVPSSPFDHYAVGDTDSSADSASYARSSHSANSSPYTSSRTLTDGHGPSILPTSTLPSSASAAHDSAGVSSSMSPALASAASSLSTSPSAPPRDRPVRTKDRLKHSESENRRRTRLRHKFSLLRDSSGCVKKDRYTILTTAVAKINELQARMQQAEQEKAALLVNINNITSQQQRQQQQAQHTAALHAKDGGMAAAAPLSPLSSLSFYPLLSSVCAAFISLDGRLLDANPALCHRLGYAKEDLLHSSLFALCDPSHLVDTVCVLKRLLDGESSTWEMQRWCVSKDGGRVRMHQTLAPVHHEGRLVFFLLLMVPSAQQIDDATTAAVRQKDAFAVDARNYAPVQHAPPSLEPKHDLDSGLRYSTSFPSPPSAYTTMSGSGLSGTGHEEAMRMLQSSPPASSPTHGTNFLASSPSPLSSSQLQPSMFASIPVEHLSVLNSSSQQQQQQRHQHGAQGVGHHPQSGEPVVALKQEYGQQAERSSHPRSSSPAVALGGPLYGRALSLGGPYPPQVQSHERPPSESSTASAASAMSYPPASRRTLPASISTSAEFPRHPGHTVAQSQSAALMDATRGSWARPSLSAPNSPAAMHKAGGRPAMLVGGGGGGGSGDQQQGSMDWLYGQAPATANDAAGGRKRPPLVDMRC